MTETFDTELKSALALRVETIPDEVVTRLGSANYGPRVRRRHVAVAASSGGVAVVTAVVTVTLGVFGPGVQNAFASWTPTPTAHTAAQDSAAESACAQSITYLAQQDNTSPALPNVTVGPGGLNPVVEDIRGDFTLVVFAGTAGSAGAQASCLTGGTSWPAGPQVTVSARNGDSAMISVGGMGVGKSGTGSFTVSGSNTNVSSTVPAAGQAGPASGNWNSVSNDHVAFGLVGAGVTGVTLHLSDGTSVVTTVANGYYAAWWPGDATVTATDVSTASGS
jgi:hypothetical protein